MLKKIINIVIILLLITPNISYAQDIQDPVELISLDFKGMDVIDVLKLLAQRGNMNMAISKNVRGKVTMFLKDVSVQNAFEIILTSNELAYESNGNILNVMTAKDYERLYGQRFHDRRIMKTFQMDYAKATNISKALAQIKSKIGKVIVDEGANTIVIMDSPDVISRAAKIIAALDKPIETRVFTLDYGKVDDIKPKIEEILTPNIGLIQVDERTNKLIITDLSSKMPLMEELINELDEKTMQVLIEAKILEVTLENEFKFGVDWDQVLALAGAMSGPIGLGVNFADAISGNILPTETGSVIGGAFEIGTLDGHKYHAVLEILQTIGKTEVLSSPRIVVINNEEASILVGTNQPYATTGTTISETLSQTTQSVTYIDLGVKLFVTPTINRNGYITMKIKPEVSSQTGNVPIVSNDGTTTTTTNIPIISTSEAETTVMVKDGNTIILAGLIEKRTVEQENSIPFLSDIPLIGYLFKSVIRGTDESPERKELIIFLTPHIISGDVRSPEVNEYLTTTDIGKSLPRHEPKKNTKTRFRDKTARNTEEPVSKQFKKSDRKKVVRYSSAMSRQNYYRLIRGRVLAVVKDNYPRSRISGDVLVSFKVSSDGSLASSPRILSSVDPTLETLAIRSVRQASPFPRFPGTMTKSMETFKLIITYR